MIVYIGRSSLVSYVCYFVLDLFFGIFFLFELWDG